MYEYVCIRAEFIYLVHVYCIGCKCSTQSTFQWTPCMQECKKFQNFCKSLSWSTQHISRDMYCSYFVGYNQIISDRCKTESKAYFNKFKTVKLI